MKNFLTLVFTLLFCEGAFAKVDFKLIINSLGKKIEAKKYTAAINEVDSSFKALKMGSDYGLLRIQRLKLLEFKASAVGKLKSKRHLASLKKQIKEAVLGTTLHFVALPYLFKMNTNLKTFDPKFLDFSLKKLKKGLDLLTRFRLQFDLSEKFLLEGNIKKFRFYLKGLEKFKSALSDGELLYSSQVILERAKVLDMLGFSFYASEFLKIALDFYKASDFAAPRLYARLLNTQCSLFHHSAELSKLKRVIETAFQHAIKTGIKTALQNCLWSLHYAVMFTKDKAPGKQLLKMARSLAKTDEQKTIVLFQEANLESLSGRGRESLKAAQSALKLAKKTGNRYLVSTAYRTLSKLNGRAGNWKTALGHNSAAMKWSTKSSRPSTANIVANTFTNMASLEILPHLKKFKEAKTIAAGIKENEQILFNSFNKDSGPFYYHLKLLRYAYLIKDKKGFVSAHNQAKASLKFIRDKEFIRFYSSILKGWKNLNMIKHGKKAKGILSLNTILADMKKDWNPHHPDTVALNSWSKAL